MTGSANYPLKNYRDESKARGVLTGGGEYATLSFDHVAGSEMKLPRLALSVRQPSAWAIIHGGKDVENRTAYSVKAGGMVTGRIAIHAATGMKQAEYEWSVLRMGQNGVSVPRPDALVRGAVIGSVEVEAFVTESASPWFGGKVGLVLRDPVACEPIPCVGARGYFEWEPGGDLVPPLKWMVEWGGAEGGLFGDLPLGFAETPEKPFGRKG